MSWARPRPLPSISPSRPLSLSLSSHLFFSVSRRCRFSPSICLCTHPRIACPHASCMCLHGPPCLYGFMSPDSCFVSCVSCLPRLFSVVARTAISSAIPPWHDFCLLPFAHDSSRLSSSRLIASQARLQLSDNRFIRYISDSGEYIVIS